MIVNTKPIAPILRSAIANRATLIRRLESRQIELGATEHALLTIDRSCAATMPSGMWRALIKKRAALTEKAQEVRRSLQSIATELAGLHKKINAYQAYLLESERYQSALQEDRELLMVRQLAMMRTEQVAPEGSATRIDEPPAGSKGPNWCERDQCQEKVPSQIHVSMLDGRVGVDMCRNESGLSTLITARRREDRVRLKSRSARYRSVLARKCSERVKLEIGGDV